MGGTSIDGIGHGCMPLWMCSCPIQPGLCHASPAAGKRSSLTHSAFLVPGTPLPPITRAYNTGVFVMRNRPASHALLAAWRDALIDPSRTTTVRWRVLNVCLPQLGV